MIANAPDTDTLGLVCITLGHLVSSDFRIASEVLAHNCIERLSCHIEKFSEETLLRLQDAVKKYVFKKHFGDDGTLDTNEFADDYDPLIF